MPKLTAEPQPLTERGEAAQIEAEVSRIRALSKGGQHGDALAAAEALIAAAPAHRDALYLMAANQRSLNQVPEALMTLQRLEEHHPRFSLLYQERGYCYLTLRDVPRAMEAFQNGVNLNPALATSWGMLERLYRATGQTGNAEAAAMQVVKLNQLPPEVVQAGSLFCDGGLAGAEKILRAFLGTGASHVEALRLLARIEHQRDGLAAAEALLQAALKSAPDNRAARLDYVRVLIDRQKYAQALEAMDRGDDKYLPLYATAQAGLGEHEAAAAIYRQLLAVSPQSAELHVSLGHSLKAAGRQKEATESYKQAAATRPSFGDAYWSLANLKTYRFSQDEIARMRCEESAAAANSADRYHLCFALGKALEDRGEYAESWTFYERGNALRRAQSLYRPEISETNTSRQMEVCTAQFLRERAQAGAPDADPIFIVGLPRSGSTLIEQILASHSQVEGTQELPDIQRIVLELEGRCGEYPGALAKLGSEDFRKLGEQYLSGARAYRRTGKPFFIDKMPNNFRHIGLIHLMLPGAKIIDVRREPMACCFSNLKQLYASGQEFSYSSEDIGRYYRSYLKLMEHWNAVLPGRVLRIVYEDVVEDLEGNVRRVLEFCGLPFEPACVEFHKTERSVRTASSEQVRQPIFREGLSQWRNYEAWLQPLKTALGDAPARYRQ